MAPTYNTRQYVVSQGISVATRCQLQCVWLTSVARNCILLLVLDH